MKKICEKLTYANVVATIALFLAIGGATAMAANQLAKNSVGAKQLRSNAVTAAKIKNGAVTSPKLAAGAVGAAQLADGSVSTAKLLDGSVTSGKLGTGSVGSSQLGSSSVGADKLVDGAVGSSKLGDGSVTSTKIPDGSITESKLADHYLTASTVGVPLAGANVSSSGTVLRWFNRFGGKPTVERTVTGFYVLIFPGLEEQGGVSTSIATATLIGEAGQISRSSTGNNPAVETYDSAGAPANRQFEFTLIAAG